MSTPTIPSYDAFLATPCTATTIPCPSSNAPHNLAPPRGEPRHPRPRTLQRAENGHLSLGSMVCAVGSLLPGLKRCPPILPPSERVFQPTRSLNQPVQVTAVAQSHTSCVTAFLLDPCYRAKLEFKAPLRGHERSRRIRRRSRIELPQRPPQRLDDNSRRQTWGNGENALHGVLQLHLDRQIRGALSQSWPRRTVTRRAP